MSKCKLIQTQYNALRDTVIERTEIGVFTTRARAEDFLFKRGYRFDPAYNAWICGNTVQFPVTMEEITYGPFDIRSFG